MRKLILALSAVLLLASFTQNTNNTIVLKDIDGTLLKSYPVIEQVNGEYTVTFTVDVNTVVTSNIVDDQMHVYLVESGNSNETATHKLSINASSVDFNHYFEASFDVVDINGVSEKVAFYGHGRPRGVIK